MTKTRIAAVPIAERSLEAASATPLPWGTENAFKSRSLVILQQATKIDAKEGLLP